MVRFEHRFTVKAPLEEVAEFHSKSASMGTITPPPMIVRVHAAPATLKSGDVMDFTLWAGPLPIRWVACIENASATGFTDRQLRGPFASWVHRHGFEPIDDGSTDVIDRVEASYRRHPFWAVAGRLMWLGVPLLFAFRARRSRAILEAA